MVRAWRVERVTCHRCGACVEGPDVSACLPHHGWSQVGTQWVCAGCNGEVAMGAHNLNRASLDESLPVVASENPSTSRPRSIRREASRRLAASLLDQAMTARGWSNGMVARCLGVSESAVRLIRSGERGFDVGDLLLLGSLGLSVVDELSRRLADAKAKSATREAAAHRWMARECLAQAAVARALADDGRIDDAEVRGIRTAMADADEAKRDFWRVIAEGGR